MYMMAYVVHLLANTVHQVKLLFYMIGYAVHQSGVPEVQHGLCSTLDGYYSTDLRANCIGTPK